MFTPPEIPLSGYSPPQTDAYLPAPAKTSSMYPHQYESTYAPPPTDFYQPPPQQSGFSSGGPPQSGFSTGAPQQSGFSSGAPPPSFRKIDPSQVYGAQFPVQNFTPKPFNPSPIAQEKLAIFEPEIRLQQPVIRRPLTVPNQRVSNVSPTPFGGSSQFESHSNAPW